MFETKEWTLMFYLASDNPLAPGVVSQLKAIKSAGYHPEANVVTQFDPFVEGTPTHIFDVNLMNKLKRPNVADVGFEGNDPFVRNLVEDKLWREQRTRNGKSLKRELKRILKQNHEVRYEAPTPPENRTESRRGPHDILDEPEPQESLRRFLSFCRNRYPAKHFALFILGHGVVVGNDVFLYDEHASEHSISLTELGEVLREFKMDIDEAEFELVSFHSCSVSSVEVAFELQETANYMLASQGPAFVGSWPYRSILIRIFNDLIREGSNIKIERMFHRIFKLCFFNAVDFLLAGYSFQLTLLDLRNVGTLFCPMAALVKTLLDGLKVDSTRDIILLSHLKSQSFFQEMYTDLYDFCFCINNKIKEVHCKCPEGTPCQCVLPDELRDLKEACDDVMCVLVKKFPKRPKDWPDPCREPNEEEREDWLIVSAEFLGPSYQYSRGLSIYFPWTRPPGDRRILSEYGHYRFHLEFEPEPTPGVHPPVMQGMQAEKAQRRSWLTFLIEYFGATLRETSSAECDPKRYLPAPDDCPHDPKCPPPTDPCKVKKGESETVEEDRCPENRATAKKEEPNPCGDERELREDIANLIYGEGPSLGSYELAGNKTGPKDPTGGISDCECATIKNYPRDTRSRRERTEEAPGPKTRIEVTQAPFL